MTRRLIRAATVLATAAIVAGGVVVGAGTASAEGFVSSVTDNSTALTPEQWVDLGLNLAALPLLLGLDAAGSVDPQYACHVPSGGQPCPPPTAVEQLLAAVGS